jgi:hypothetical protein
MPYGAHFMHGMRATDKWQGSRVSPVRLTCVYIFKSHMGFSDPAWKSIVWW